jgi:hypothetical protein
MFVYDEESRTHWFNRFTNVDASQFVLVGMILGLAIYNGVILNVRFPGAVYKKLLGWPTTLADLKEAMPVSLQINCREVTNL